MAFPLVSIPISVINIQKDWFVEERRLFFCNLHSYVCVSHTHIYMMITNVSGQVRLEYILSKIIYESKRKKIFIKQDIINSFIIELCT